MSKDNILSKLQKSIEEFDAGQAEAAAKEALAAGLDPIEAIQQGLSQGMNTISELFDEGEIFVPQILLAAEAFETAVNVLTSTISVEEKNKASLGKVLIHTVQGDIHDVGKNIVKTMLAASGFEVIDLGRDIPVDEVVAKAKELNVDIIAGSALMTTTMPAQRDILASLGEEGIRAGVKCLFGGAPVTQEWVDQIGADGYAENAAEAIKQARKLVS
ncbi:corrinoid protein [Phosphitispora fastidiosa]|uniref:corrinoid protein n=1 Tax=Phosphitispora fastidiosa TaxID=2837202 RepID=UPI001E2DF4D4|nr:corrinoid protein [Phosphitispora fastidiosa]MBU7008395.1 trimethylamine corrinoid protein [Phosphitispora fastidiosa]